MAQETAARGGSTTARGFVRSAVRVVCVMLAAASLAGCIVAPAPYYRHYPRYYYPY